MAPVGYIRVIDIQFYGKGMEIPAPENQLTHTVSFEHITFDK